LAMNPSLLRRSAVPAEHGSSNRRQKNGYRVERVSVNPDGSNASQEVFASGWLENGTKILGRPSDVIVAPDGSLLVADDQAGAIYQVSYVGAK